MISPSAYRRLCQNVDWPKRKKKEPQDDIEQYDEEEMREEEDSFEWNHLERGALSEISEQKEERLLESNMTEFTLRSMESAEVEETIDSLCDSLSDSQSTYMRLCRKFKLTPSQKLLNSFGRSDIRIVDQNLGPGGAYAIAASFVSNESIRVLELSSVNIGLDGTNSIITLISENPNIMELHIKNDHIGDCGAYLVTQAIVNTPHIVILDLSGNDLGEKSGTYIRYLLQKSETLAELYLSNNNFMKEGAIEIAFGLAHNTTLKKIDLSWNHIRGQGAIAICDSLGRNKGLKVMNLSWNGLFYEGCVSLMNALPKNNTIVDLDVSCNRIDDKCLERLTKGLMKNKALKILKIGLNPITNFDVRNFLTILNELKYHSVEVIDVKGITVDRLTLNVANKISSKWKFELSTGTVLKQSRLEDAQDPFLNEDPLMVLLEYIKLKNLRLVDLFLTIDSDGNHSLDYKEFKNGLKEFGVPLNDHSVDLLIRKIDADKSGEIEYREFTLSQREYRRRVMRLMREERDLPYEETEIGRINIKLKKVLSQRTDERISKVRERLKERKLSNLASISSVAFKLGSMRTSTSSPSIDTASYREEGESGQMESSQGFES